MKRVVMLNSMSFLPHQGRYLRIYNQAKTLVEAGYDVTLIAWDREANCPASENVDGIRVERIPVKARFGQTGPVNALRFIAFYAKLLKRILFRKLDAIHCFNLDTMLVGLPVAKLRRKKVTLDLCEPSYYTYWSRRYMPLIQAIGGLERSLSKRFDYVFVHNLYQIRKFMDWGVRYLEQISSAPQSKMIVAQPAAQRDGKELVLGRIGTIYPESGIEETMAAVRHMIEKGAPIKLLLAGKIMDGYETDFASLVRPIEAHVEVSGPYHAAQLRELYARVDFSIQLYRLTDWYRNITPTKFFESLAHGVPVIASDMGDLRELIEAHDCGIVVDETDPESVFLGLKQVLEEPERVQEMAGKGLRLVREEYNWDVMGKRLLSRYEAMLG
jgi:glycosyltransferase involved in cell wall biosynthesis